VLLNWPDAAGARMSGEERSVHVPGHGQLRLWLAYAQR